MGPMSLEIRTLEESPEVVSRFVVDSWLKVYGGRAPVLDWSAEYFEWQIFHRRPGGRDLLLGAYDRGRLVGTVMLEPWTLDHLGEPMSAALASWLTVDPDCWKRGVALEIYKEVQARIREQGLEAALSFTVDGALGEKFLRREPRIGPLRFWYRILDGHRLARSVGGRQYQALCWVLGPISDREPPRPARRGVRDYRPEDLEACLDLVGRARRPADLGLRWSADRLAHQLDFRGYPRTMVLESGGRIEGLANWYPIDGLGLRRNRISIVDLLICGEVSRAERRGLIGSALRRMRDEGSSLVMLAEWTPIPGRDLLATGFLRFPAEYHLLMHFSDRDPRSIRSYELLFR